ncbi:hypothetical protein VDG1235_2690 [Verrucomicrobiia bacterium DG1235]|nr:hypothetical protein VDG1235_2690 [Verrucomicrobiae bacterium DG1235]
MSSFSGLWGITEAAHIHAATAVAGSGTAGVATQVPNLPAFPLGVPSGSYDQTFDLTAISSYNPGFLTASGGTAAGAQAALTTALSEGKTYLNIHTSFASDGEIRGFLKPESVPDTSSTALLLSLGLLGLFSLISQSRKRKIEVR